MDSREIASCLPQRASTSQFRSAISRNLIFRAQKSPHSLLVGRVEGGWEGASTPACFVAQIQTGEILSVRSGKTQLTHLLEIEVVERHFPPLWVG